MDGAHPHTVFSISQCAYQLWQAELLAFSHARAGRPGPLTCLVGAVAPEAPGPPGAVFVPAASPHPLTGDDYAPYNKPSSLLTWTGTAPIAEDAVLLLDPDCVFLRPLADAAVARGRPIAQPYGYMQAAPHERTLRRHFGRPDLLDPVGIPILIHRDDLAALAPVWMARTEALRGDQASRIAFGWTCEMWGYCIAAAELGLRHTLRDMAQTSLEQRSDLPIVHYCYPGHDASTRWQWDKRTYRAWERVPEPPSGVPAALGAALRVLNELADIKQLERR